MSSIYKNGRVKVLNESLDEYVEGVILGITSLRECLELLPSYISNIEKDRGLICYYNSMRLYYLPYAAQVYIINIKESKLGNEYKSIGIYKINNRDELLKYLKEKKELFDIFNKDILKVYDFLINILINDGVTLK